MASLGSPPDNLILNSVLGLCVSSLEINSAQALLHRWKEVTDVVSCNILLKGCAQIPDLRKAEAILAGMSEHGPEPNLISYNTVMDCAVRCMRGPGTEKQGRATSDTDGSSLAAIAKRPWELIDQLISRGLEPDRYTCSTLVKGMHMAGCTATDIDRAVEILYRVGASALQAKAEGHGPNGTVISGQAGYNERLLEVLFNTLLDACITVHDLDRMAKIFSMMQEFGVSVSAVTYGTLIKAFGQSGHLNRCHEAWENMQKSQIQPTIVTYGCYVDACIRNEDLTRAEATFESMATAAHGVRPNAVIYTSLIRGFAKAKQPQKALAFYRRMRDEGIEATSVTFNSILDIVARQLSEPDVLQEVIDDMCRAGSTPDTVTYSILIKASCSEGQIQNALSLFRQFQRKGLPIDQVAVNTILLACSKAEQIEDAEDIFAEMRRMGMTPTHVTTSIMVKMYGKAKMLEKAIEVTDMLEKEYGQKPNLFVYTCLIQACTQNRQVRRSWEIFNKMVNSGIEPDAVTYGTVIHGCVYLNKFPHAMSLVRHAYKLPSFSQSDADSPFLGMPFPKNMVPLQMDVMQTLLGAMRRKQETQYVMELEQVLATHGADQGKPHGGRQPRRGRSSNEGF